MLPKVKLALRLTVDKFDDELTGMIEAAKADLNLSGVQTPDDDPLIERAVITFCRANFGSPADYDKLRASYETQKALLMVASGYGFLGEG